jgi:excinuclease ABC subunit A
VVVIEHNLEVIKTADWIIDLGPEGGDKGGEIVAEGTPEQVAKEPRSYTGHYLAPLLTTPATPTSARVERSRDTAAEPAKPRRRSSSVRLREAAE